MFGSQIHETICEISMEIVKERQSDSTKERAGTKSFVAIYRPAQDRDKWGATAVNCVPSV